MRSSQIPGHGDHLLDWAGRTVRVLCSTGKVLYSTPFLHRISFFVLPRPYSPSVEYRRFLAGCNVVGTNLS